MASEEFASEAQLHEYGELLAEVDDRLNRALRETDGDELAAEELLRREEERGPAS
jgi:hypothetical protein